MRLLAIDQGTTSTRAMVFAGDQIEVGHLPPEVRGHDAPPVVADGEPSLRERFGGNYREARDAMQRELLTEAIAAHGGVHRRAAAALGMDAGQLSRLTKRLGLR